MVISTTLVALIMTMAHSNKPNLLNNNIQARSLLLFMIMAVSINIVFRDLNYIDTGNYTMAFSFMDRYSLWELYQVSASTEWLFVFTSWIVAKFTDDPRLYLLFLWAVFLIPFYSYLKRLLNPWQMAVMFFAYINFPIFYSYTANVLRQGIATSFLLLALTYLVNGEKSKKPYIFMTIAVLFHWTGISFALALLILAKLKLRMRTVLAVWSILAILFITGFNHSLDTFFGRFVPKLDVYNAAVLQYTRTKRIDFLLFSFIWIVIGLLLYRFVYREEAYKTIIKAYVIFNSLFLLFGFLSYSDRIAGYSWFLIPLLVLYPFMKAKKYPVAIVYTILVAFFAVGWYTGVYRYYNPFQLAY